MKFYILFDFIITPFELNVKSEFSHISGFVEIEQMLLRFDNTICFIIFCMFE